MARSFTINLDTGRVTSLGSIYIFPCEWDHNMMLSSANQGESPGECLVLEGMASHQEQEETDETATISDRPGGRIDDHERPLASAGEAATDAFYHWRFNCEEFRQGTVGLGRSDSKL